MWWCFAFHSALQNPSNHVVPEGENPHWSLVPRSGLWETPLQAGSLPPSFSKPHRPCSLKFTEQSIPQAFHVSLLSCPCAYALASDGEVARPGSIFILGALLEFPQTGTSAQDAFVLPFVLGFTIAVNHRVLRGLTYVSVFPTGKLGDLLAIWGICSA